MSKINEAENKEQAWIVGYGNGVTGPTVPTCSQSGPFCGGEGWPYTIVTCEKAVIAVVPAQGESKAPRFDSDKKHANLIAAAPRMLEDLDLIVLHVMPVFDFLAPRGHQGHLSTKRSSQIEAARAILDRAINTIAAAKGESK